MPGESKIAGLSVTQKKNKSQYYFPALDGLRGILAVGVVMVHIHVPWFPGAPIMMEIFFVISGFLITSIIAREVSKTGKIDLVMFWRRRLRRLWPTLFVVVLSTLCIAWLVRDLISFPYALSDAVATIFYFSNWTKLYDYVYPSMYGQTWSLSVEEQFYLFWPVLFTLSLALKLRPYQFVVLLVLLALASMLWRYYLIYDGAPWSRLYYALETRMDAFVVGGILALNFDRLQAITEKTWWRVCLNICVLVLIYVIVTGRPYEIEYFKGRQTAVLFLSAATILLLSAPRDGFFKWFSCLSWFMFLGRRSYSVYLWHWPVIWLLVQTTELREVPLALVVLPVTMVLSSLSYSFVEIRFLSNARKRQLESEA